MKPYKTFEVLFPWDETGQNLKPGRVRTILRISRWKIPLSRWKQLPPIDMTFSTWEDGDE